jgi:hypothetical protein
VSPIRHLLAAGALLTALSAIGRSQAAVARPTRPAPRAAPTVEADPEARAYLGLAPGKALRTDIDAGERAEAEEADAAAAAARAALPEADLRVLVRLLGAARPTAAERCQPMRTTTHALTLLPPERAGAVLRSLVDR